jgi:hypothetical protein
MEKKEDLYNDDIDTDGKRSYMTDSGGNDKNKIIHFKRWTMKQYIIYMWIALLIAISPIYLYVMYLVTRIKIKQYFLAIFTSLENIYLIYRVVLISKIIYKPKEITVESITLVYYIYIFGLIFFMITSFECLIFTKESFEFHNSFQKLFGNESIEYYEEDKWVIWVGRFFRAILFNLPDALIFKKLIFYLTYNYEYDDCDFDEDYFLSSLSFVIETRKSIVTSGIALVSIDNTVVNVTIDKKYTNNNDSTVVNVMYDV